MANLINSGILPLTFMDESDYDKISEFDTLYIENPKNQIENGSIITVKAADGTKFLTNISISERQKGIITAGGLLNYTKNNN